MVFPFHEPRYLVGEDRSQKQDNKVDIPVFEQLETSTTDETSQKRCTIQGTLVKQSQSRSNTLDEFVLAWEDSAVTGIALLCMLVRLASPRFVLLED